jgi:hypothetical protein
MMKNGAPKPHLNSRQSVLELIEQLSRKKDCNQVYIRRKGFSLAMGKSANTQTPRDDIIPR